VSHSVTGEEVVAAEGGCGVIMAWWVDGAPSMIIPRCSPKALYSL
jgi:hypothetical protein